MMNTHSGSSVLKVGEVTETWCKTHGRLVDHLYTGHSLICCECHPESAPKKAEEK